MGLAMPEDADPGSHSLGVFGTLYVFVSQLGPEAYFVCQRLIGLHMWSVRQPAHRMTVCTHGVPGGSFSPGPLSLLLLTYPSLAFSLRASQSSNVWKEACRASCSKSIISKGGALRSGKRPLGTLNVCL